MFKRLKFHYKLFISFSIFIFIILFISGVIFYVYTVSIIEKNITDTQNRTTQKLQEQLDGLLSGMDKISISVNSSQYILDLLKNIPNDPENNYFDINIRANDAVKNALFSFISPSPIKGRISIITKNYDYTDLNNQLDSQLVTKEYIKKVSRVGEIMSSDQYKFFVPPHQDNWSANNSIVFSVDRPIRDNYNVYGLVEVSRSIQDIDNICNFKDADKKPNVAIFDDKENLIYDNFDSSYLMDKKLLYSGEIASSSFGSYIKSIPSSKTKLIASFSRLSIVNWTVVQFEDMKTFRKPVSFLSNMIIITYISVFIILLLVLYVFTRSITKPIMKLKDTISNVDAVNLKFDFKTTNNEIAILGNAFQDLLSEVKINTEKMLQSHSRETKAHLLALQAQLNPHFLYNTLAVIGAYGQKKGNNEVAEMCVDLAQMLRYTVKLDDNKTCIKSEVLHIKNYLKLMNTRFEGFLEYSINVDEAINEITVPKLLLEPIIENTFRHAFVNVDPPWIVRIEGYIKHEKWYIKISDNGRGLNEDAIKKLQEKIENSKKGPYDETYSSDVKKGGLGLTNTFMRLHIYFDGKEYIDFYNAPEGGAVITIGGPIS